MPRVFTIPASAPFLQTLIGALTDGRLIDGFPGHDPLALADATLFLPTRRACALAREGFGGYAPEFFWGFISSAVSGFLVIWGLLTYLRRHDFLVFMVYRLAVAALVLLVIATGVRPASGL